jgi:IS5 family transposase
MLSEERHKTAKGPNMSDPQAEDSLYDSAAMRDLVGNDLRNEAAPDETTICKF